MLILIVAFEVVNDILPGSTLLQSTESYINFEFPLKTFSSMMSIATFLLNLENVFYIK